MRLKKIKQLNELSNNNGSVTFNLEVIALKIWLVSLLAIS